MKRILSLLLISAILTGCGHISDDSPDVAEETTTVMKTIKGGIETADMIIDRWRELYCNRRAMMQEINKVADESDYGVK